MGACSAKGRWQLNSENPYRVNLEVFEGPLDLLLYLIKREELDIWDIPIALIMEEYMSYVDLMQELNLGVAGEFLLMASMLAAIKSRMLLNAHATVEGEEIDDPRMPLVERLLEYQRYKEAAQALTQTRVLNRDVFPRGFPALDIPEGVPTPTPDVGLYDLMSALQDVLGRVLAREFVHVVQPGRFSVMDRIHWLHDRLDSGGALGFRRLLESLDTRSSIIVTFLALLEMLKANIIRMEPIERLPPHGNGRRSAEEAPRNSSGEGAQEVASGSGGEGPRGDEGSSAGGDVGRADERQSLDWAISLREPGADLEMAFEDLPQ